MSNRPYCEEAWEPAKGFPDYLISDSGRVLSYKWKRWHEIFPFENSVGYFVVCLGDNKKIPVHRLVALAFLDNSDNNPCVNHINGDKHDNRVINLEWCTYSENNQHAYDFGLNSNARRIRVVETGEEFISEEACARSVNGNSRMISQCLKGSSRRRSHRGFHFEYV